jgi:hypothetical protein
MHIPGQAKRGQVSVLLQNTCPLLQRQSGAVVLSLFHDLSPAYDRSLA